MGSHLLKQSNHWPSRAGHRALQRHFLLRCALALALSAKGAKQAQGSHLLRQRCWPRPASAPAPPARPMRWQPKRQPRRGERASLSVLRGGVRFSVPIAPVEFPWRGLRQRVVGALARRLAARNRRLDAVGGRVVRRGPALRRTSFGDSTPAWRARCHEAHRASGSARSKSPTS
jgi:hypothetical protein